MVHFIRPYLGDEERQAVLEVLNSGQLAAGAEVAAFEKEFAAYIGTEYAVATCNGTAALHAALAALGIGPGDKVITTPFSFVATANAIVFCGAEPIFCDIDPDTYNLDPVALEACLDAHPDVKAVLVVHLFGLPADMNAIGRLCAERGVLLVEDCAQAHGARYHGRRVGTFGQAAAFSFYATKNMTTGEGGAVLSNDPEIAERVRTFTNHGRVGRYLHDRLGYNLRMTNLAAALGRVQLRRLDGWNERRRANAAFLTEHLADLDWLQTPRIPEGCEPVFHQYTVRTPYRDALVEWLRQHEVGCDIIYPVPLHQQPFYVARNGAAQVSLPEAERAAREVVSLPVYPGLTDDQLAEVVEVVRSFRPGKHG